jgi:hypothetical protein
MLKQLLAAAAALALAAPLAAQAQEVPSYAAVQSDQQIQGRIAAFDGAYNLQVRDDNGYIDNVELHDGTIINPTGLTLAPGMVVNILGSNGGGAFDADEIDTPYTFDDAVPYYGGHPWNYYGPSVGLSFFFGNTGWWHRSGYHREFNRNVAYVSNRQNNTYVNRDVNRDEPQPRERYSAPARTAQPPQFSAPVRRAPVVIAPVERVTQPVPVSRNAPAGRFSGNAGGSFHPVSAPRESHGTVQPRGRR